MKLFSSVLVLLICFFSVPDVIAKDYFDAPLSPGTTIIAGDLSKNEFYIVAEKDVPKLKLALKEVVKPKAVVSINKKVASKRDLIKKEKDQSGLYLSGKKNHIATGRLRAALKKQHNRTTAKKHEQKPKHFALYNKSHLRKDY